MKKLIEKLNNYYFGVVFGALLIAIINGIVLYFQLTAPSIPLVVKAFSVGCSYFRLRKITYAYYAAIKDH